jgi:hypothetical protein
MKKIFELGQKIFYFFSFVNPLYEPILVFPKFDPITAPGMALKVHKSENFFDSDFRICVISLLFM